ncbi:hypothetical protein GW17_00034988 [Ensete ventricosum]|nr:hypothetical protein GW17_00034988 [Ensete ventricosum]
MSAMRLSVRVVDGTSGIVEDVDPRPQIVKPLGNLKVAVVNSSWGGMTPGDSKAYRALSAIWSSHDMTHPTKGGSEPSSKRKAPLPEKRSKSKGKESRKEVAGGQGRPLIMKDLCETGGQAGEDMYFVTRMLDLSVPEAGTPLKVQWADLLAPTQFWTG